MPGTQCWIQTNMPEMQDGGEKGDLLRNPTVKHLKSLFFGLISESSFSRNFMTHLLRNPTVSAPKMGPNMALDTILTIFILFTLFNTISNTSNVHI